MNAIETLIQDIAAVITGNKIYQTYYPIWKYYLESYMGGDEYRRAGHLTRYQLETDQEYNNRLRATPLENHCASVISVFNSFLFREEPDRELESVEYLPETEDFLKDADMEGRSLNAFMKDVSTWTNVFGHAWIIVAKPNVGAVTRADEQALGVRPYVNLLTPLVVLDWTWQRQPSGRFELTYLKYLEDVNGDVRTVKEWTKEVIVTTVVNLKDQVIEERIEEINGLGKIPAVCVYNKRSTVRGIGISSIGDIANHQKYIYNSYSEIFQSIQMDTHPSLVVAGQTQVGTGSGAIIRVEENSDPGLKPYVLNFGSSDINNILAAIRQSTDAIDKMANTGAVRATESRTMSGVAMETEFQLLNARLSEMADELELAEENLWKFWCEYMGYEWDGEIDYPGSFNIRDTGSEIAQLQQAKSAATDPIVLRKIDEHILEWMDEEKEALPYTDINPITGRTYPDGEPIPQSLPPLYKDSSEPDVPPNQNCANCEYYNASEGYCNYFDANVRPLFWCAKWDEKHDE